MAIYDPPGPIDPMWGLLSPPPQTSGAGPLGGAAPQVAPPGQPTWMAGISDFFRQNPALIANLAAGIGSAPNMKAGIAKAAGGMPTAMQSDLQTQQYQKQQAAVGDFFKNPANTKALSPGQIQFMKAYPDIATKYISQGLTSGERPLSPQEKAYWGIGPNVPAVFDLTTNSPKILSSAVNTFDFSGGTGTSGPAPDPTVSSGNAAPTGNGRYRSPTADEAVAKGIPTSQLGQWQIDQSDGKWVKAPNSGTSSANSVSDEQIAKLGDGIIAHTIPPPPSTGSGSNTAVAIKLKAYLADHGFDLTRASEDYTATIKRIGTANTGPFVQQQNSIALVESQLPRLQAMADKWNAGQYPDVNVVRGWLAGKGLGDADPTKALQAQSLYQQMTSLVKEMQPELSKIYSGGYAATDAQLAHADAQLSQDWSLQTLTDMIKLAQTNIDVRKNTLASMLAGPSSNPYDQVTPYANVDPATSPAPTSDPRVSDPLGIR